MVTQLPRTALVHVQGRTQPGSSFVSRHRNDLVGFGLFAVVLAVAPFFAPPSVLSILVFAMIFALPALGLNLLMGLAGQVSLGQAAFFAAGAYTHAILVTQYELPALLAALCGVAVAGALGLLIGLPLLRLRGHYLALATLGVGFIVSIVARESDFTGRTTGVYGLPRPEIFGMTISNNALFLWFIAPVVLIALLVALNLSRSRAGRALSAVNDSELAAESLGVKTYPLRLGVLVLSAAMSGLGGVFYVTHVGLVNPTAANFHLSVEILLMAVIGGLGSVWGAVFGAVIVQFLVEGLRDLIPVLIPGATGEVQLVGYGLVLVLVIIALPGGLHQAALTLWRSARSRLGGAPEDGAPAPPPPADTAHLPTVSAPLPRGETILEVSGLTKRYGGVTAVDSVSFHARAGTIVGLIGPNGAGKTTCFNMMSGALVPSSGHIRFLGKEVSGKKPSLGAGLGMARTFQNLEIFVSTNVIGNVYMGRYRLGRAGILRGMLGLQHGEQREHFAVAAEVLTALQLREHASADPTALPFGTQRMVEIGRALAAEPALLLLDEPMAGLSGAERNRLAELLRQLREAGLTILIVEHDVDKVMSLADQVVVLDDGALIADGDPETVRTDPQVIAAYLGAEVDELVSVADELTPRPNPTETEAP